MEDQQTPALEAGDEVVDDTAQTPEPEEREADEPSGEESESQDKAPDDDGADKTSRSKARRERQKAERERLRTERDAANARAAELEQRLKDASVNDPAPKREDFRDYDEYLAAFASHRAVTALTDRDRRKIEAEAEQSKASLAELEQRDTQAMHQSLAEMQAEARTKYADYDAVVRNPSLQITTDMARVIANTDVGGDIAYYLGSNPAESAQIARMQPLEMARHLGRIEARLSLPQAPNQTRAPDPVTPVKPKASAVKDPAKMTNDEYRRWRQGK